MQTPTACRWPRPRGYQVDGPVPGQARRPLRVLHIVRRFWPLVGGTERYVFDLASAQASRRRDVTVLTLNRDVARVVRDRLPESESADGVSIMRVAGWGNRRIAVSLRPRVVARSLRNCDVIHLHDLRFLFGTAVAASLVFRKPLIVHTHGLLFHTPWAAPLKRMAMATYFGPILRASGARIVCSSESDRAVLLRHAPYLREQAITFENAIPTAALASLNRRPRRGLITCIGRVTSSKGIDDLIAALARVRAPWELIVAGAEEPEERRRLEETAAAAGISRRVRFHGAFARESLADFLTAAELAVFPSRAEGFGLAVLEAMSAGVPVLARDIPPHAELLGPSLRDMLIDFSNHAAAAQAIERVLGSPPELKEEDTRRLKERAARYDINRLVSQVDGLYVALGLEESPKNGSS